MKTKITAEEYQKISDESKYAEMILKNKNFKFVRDYLESALVYVEQSILNNTIKEVHEHQTITDKLKRVFITQKKEQIDELTGQYKFIKKFLSDLEYFVSRKQEVDSEIERKTVILEGGNDKDETYVGSR